MFHLCDVPMLTRHVRESKTNFVKKNSNILIIRSGIAIIRRKQDKTKHGIAVKEFGKIPKFCHE